VLAQIKILTIVWQIQIQQIVVPAIVVGKRPISATAVCHGVEPFIKPLVEEEVVCSEVEPFIEPLVEEGGGLLS
jgi:hypothetical protein